MSDFFAFFTGFLLFFANFALLMFLGRRWFASIGPGPVAAKPGPLMFVAMLVKFVFLGVGAFFAIVVFALPPIPFVIGLCVGLAALAFAALIGPVRRRIFCYERMQN